MIRWPKYHRVTFVWDNRRYERKGKTLAEAHEKAAALKEQLRRGEIGVSGSMTVARWADEWIETYKRPTIGEGHYKNYLSHINGVIIPAIGNMPLDKVRDLHLQKILNARTGKSKSDVGKLRMTIQAIFKQARKSRLIPYDPAEDIKAPAAEAGSHRSITPYERKMILGLAETHYAGLWIKFLLHTGIRPGETRALLRGDIDLDNRIIHVSHAIKSRTRTIGAPKSAAGIRDVPIPNVLHSALCAARGSPDTPVFPQPRTGNHHTETSMRRWWKSFYRELDIAMGAKMYRNQIVESVVAKDLTPYCLKHTYATDLQDAGVPINVAKYLLGHSDISVTSKIYTHTTEKALTDALARINMANTATEELAHGVYNL